MASSNTNKVGKPALFVFLLATILFNLSSLPGSNSEVATQSTDLMSVLLQCDLEGTVEANGAAECGDIEKDGMTGRITVKEVVPEEGSANANRGKRYVITSELECDTCPEGISSTSKTTSNLKDISNLAERLMKDQTKIANEQKREEEERLARIEACEEDEDGKEIKPKKQLECRVDRMSAMNGEEAEDYYDDYLKEELQSLLQSDAKNDRLAAISLLAKLGKDLKLACPTRPGLQLDGRNPLLSQATLSPMMSTDFGRVRERELSRSYVKESVCDLWAFGTYNHNVEFLQSIAPFANEAEMPVIKHALESLHSGWGVYFKQRGMQIHADPTGMFGRGDSLFSDLKYNSEALEKGLEAIKAQHQALLGATTLIQPQVPQAAPAAGRLARGGLPNAPGIAPGTATTQQQPWPQTPNGTAAPATNTSSRMVPMDNNKGPFKIPQFGEPVGTPN